VDFRLLEFKWLQNILFQNGTILLVVLLTLPTLGIMLVALGFKSAMTAALSLEQPIALRLTGAG
jgi:hypothetical protein